MPFARSRWPSAFVGVSMVAFFSCLALVDKNTSVASQGSSVDDLFGRCVAHMEDACVKEDVIYLSPGQNHGIVTQNAKRKRNAVFRRGGSNTPFGDSMSNLLHWRGPFREFVVLERANFTTLRRHLPTVRGRTLYRYYKTTSGENGIDDTPLESSTSQQPLNAAHALWDTTWLELLVATFYFDSIVNLHHSDDFNDDDPVHGLIRIILNAVLPKGLNEKKHAEGCFDELFVVVSSCDRHLDALPATIAASVLARARENVHAEVSRSFQNDYRWNTSVLLYGRLDTKQRKMVNVVDVHRELVSASSFLDVTLWDERVLTAMPSPMEQFRSILNSKYVITPHGAFTCFWWPWLRKDATLHEIMGPCPKLHSDRFGRTYVNDEVASLLGIRHLYRGEHNLWSRKVPREGTNVLSCESHYTDPNFWTSPKASEVVLKSF